uniref:Uncharacterized protein n=1 Tax=Aegilops tauschii subsp. strangulata TaxID=200361 RepID=A0A453GYU5_AEGTS
MYVYVYVVKYIVCLSVSHVLRQKKVSYRTIIYIHMPTAFHTIIIIVQGISIMDGWHFQFSSTSM